MIFQNVVKTVTTSALFLLSGWSLAGGIDVNSNAASQDATNLIIKYKAATSETRSFFDFNASLNKLESKHKVSMTPSRLLFNQSQLVKVENGTDVNALLSQLNADPSVEYAEADTLMYAMYETDDTRYDELWGMHGPTGVNAPGAWDVTAGYGVRVAVIDTGYRAHLDLGSNLVGGYDFITNVSTSADGDGRDADATDPGTGEEGWWFIPDTRSSWHGTHVAGTIAALGNNAEGVVGVAHQSQVVPIRVLGKGGRGNTSDIVDAIVWASGGSVDGVPENQYPARVINMSLGTSSECSYTVQKAIDIARANGAVVVAAAGNASDDANDYMPAGCNGVVAVGAMEENGDLASFSNYGSAVDVIAPGRSILSTVDAGYVFPEGDSYAAYNGTSMASPHVAGVAALILSVYPDYTPDQVEELIKSTTRPFVSGSNCEGTNRCGSGMVDAMQAVEGGDISIQKAQFNFECDLLVCNFTAQSANDSSVVDWSWSLGDGTSMNGSSFSYEFAETGDYEVELTITDNEGHQYSSLKTVSVADVVIEPINIYLTAERTTIVLLFFLGRLELVWEGAETRYVDIYKDSILIADSVRNSSSGENDKAFLAFDYDYLIGDFKVCEEDTQRCSRVVTVE